MSAEAICDVCGKREPATVSPLGIALMPGHWFLSIREGNEVIQVCGEDCAKAFDMEKGLKETVLHDLDATGEEVERNIEHKIN